MNNIHIAHWPESVDPSTSTSLYTGPCVNPEGGAPANTVDFTSICGNRSNAQWMMRKGNGGCRPLLHGLCRQCAKFHLRITNLTPCCNFIAPDFRRNPSFMPIFRTLLHRFVCYRLSALSSKICLPSLDSPLCNKRSVFMKLWKARLQSLLKVLELCQRTGLGEHHMHMHAVAYTGILLRKEFQNHGMFSGSRPKEQV